MRGLSRALIVLIGLSTVADVTIAVLWWVTGSAHYVVEDLSGLAWLAAGITFIVWMFRARGVAETITPAHEHRWSKPWTIAGWLVPFVNVWIPYAVIQDIWRGSDRTAPTVPLVHRPTSGLIIGWWICYLVSFFASIGAGIAEQVAAEVIPQFVAVWYTIYAAALIAAALLVARVIRQIDDRQHAHDPVVA